MSEQVDTKALRALIRHASASAARPTIEIQAVRLSALLDELDMRRQQVLDLGEDLNGVELRAETAEAECEMLRAEMNRTIVCPLCKGEFVGQTGHLCPSAQTVGARKDALVVVHPNGPKQPGQDADAHRALAARHLEALIERNALRAENERLREALTGPVLSRIKNFQERDEHYAVDWAAVCSSIKSEVEAALAAQEHPHA